MIRIQNLSLSRGDKPLLNNLSANVQAGDVVVVLGPNGAGKSTLLLTLAGLLPLESGEININDNPLKTLTSAQLSTLMSWQGELPPTEFGLTVSQRLNLATDLPVNASSNTNSKNMSQALAHFDLQSLAERPLGKLSSGERQRVELTSLLMRDCPAWLMDEPTSHLDMRHQVDCLTLIKQQALKGRLIITVLHDLQQAAAVADVVVLFDGKGGAQVGRANDLLTAEILEPIFKVKLKGSGRNLVPCYTIEDKLT